MHFLSYPPPKFTKMFWAHFWGFHFASKKYVLGAFSRFLRPKTKVFPEVQTHFGSSLPASSREKVLGEISRVVHPKTQRFAAKFRRTLEVLCLARFIKKCWAHFLDFFVQKWSGLLWCSDAFWEFFFCKLYKQSSGRIFSIYASKNEAVCCEVQTRFGSSLPARFTEKVLGAIPRFMCPKMKRFAVKFRRILEVFAFFWKKNFWVQFYDLCVQERSCLLLNSGAFWDSRFARFMKNIQGALSRFVRPKVKLFAVMFRRISEVLRLQDLQRKFWTNFHDWCVQKRSCLLWISDAFCTFPLARLIKNCGRIFTICVSRKQTFLTSTFCKNA